MNPSTVIVANVLFVGETNNNSGLPELEIPIAASSAVATLLVIHRPEGVPSNVFCMTFTLESSSITIMEGLPLRGVCISIETTGLANVKSTYSQSLSDIIVKTGPKSSPLVKSLDEYRISPIPSPFRSIPASIFNPTFSPAEP